MSWPRPQRAPWWFCLLLALATLAAAMVFPEASHVLDSADWMGAEHVGWLYPLYVIFMAVLGWMCYPQRRTMAWILLATLCLTTLGLFIATIL